MYFEGEFSFLKLTNIPQSQARYKWMNKLRNILLLNVTWVYQIEFSGGPERQSKEGIQNYFLNNDNNLFIIMFLPWCPPSYRYLSFAVEDSVIPTCSKPNE